MLTYLDSAIGLTSAALATGFFEGWAAPPTADEHLELLTNSSHVAIAIADGGAVGFVNAISDGVLAVYIPLLEVLPDYRGRGIGTELVRRLLDRIGSMYMVDVMCDPDVLPFYERLGFQAFESDRPHSVLVAVLSDTHLRATSRRGLPESALRILDTADVILHAGDVVEHALLDELTQFAPVHAVLGNNDIGMTLPDSIDLTLGGVRVSMVHDSGPRRGRENRLKAGFPQSDVVVFGHSHIPWNARGLDDQLLFNPGSPTQRRSQAHSTMGVLALTDGRITRHEIMAVDD